MSERQFRIAMPLVGVGLVAWLAAFLWATGQHQAYYADRDLLSILADPTPPFWVEHVLPFSIAVSAGAVVLGLIVATVWRANE